jgi:hypothetical protein
MTDMDIADAAVKQTGKKDNGEDESEGQRSDCISHSMALECADTTRLHGSERV